VHLHLGIILFLLGTGFLAAFIDSIVGGGGLISVPALMMAGLPPTLAIGTNKLAAIFGTVTSTVNYFRSGKIRLEFMKILFPLSIIGSVFGAYTVRQIPSSFLRPLVIVMLILVAVYTIFKKNMGTSSTFRGLSKKMLQLSLFVALFFGFYDGFFGPGTGSFLIICFLFLGFDFVESSGNSKLLNLGSNIGALVTFLLLHAIRFEYGLWMATGMVIGSLMGSSFAIKKGAAIVRPIFLAVTFIMIGDQAWTLIR
jgi:uncharacterized protein